MRLVAISGVMASLALPICGQMPIDGGRYDIASMWLSDLCVIPVGALWKQSPSELSKAFDDWRQGKVNDSACSTGEPAGAANGNELDLSKTKLYPSVPDRLFRMAELATEAQQTPDYVFGAIENAPPGTVSTFLANTDHGIFSYGGPVHFDELFVGADQRVALCTAIGATKQGKSIARPPESHNVQWSL